MKFGPLQTAAVPLPARLPMPFDTPAHYATLREREEALRRGAQALQARFPTLQADIVVSIGPNQVEAHAAWLFAGVVMVTVRWSGDLIARSLPGQPTALDPLSIA